MKFLLLFLPLLSIAPQLGFAQTIFNNKAYTDNFKSIQAFPEGNPLGYPIAGLGSGEVLEFHFDEMTTDLNNYQYAALHCTHDWHLSDLDATEYLQGFPTQSITEFEASFNTQVEYVHHRFSFPNDMMKPRFSGNYLVVVFSGNDVSDQSTWLITYRAVVYEQMVSVAAHANGTSMIADRFKKQDMDININYENFQIIDPMRDVNVTLIQNMDWSSSINNLKPQFIQNNNLTYDYNMGENTFWGGAEYRNFEMKSLQYSSIEVEHIQREEDGYNAYLRPDLPEGKRAYSTQTDINGNYLVRNDLADDSHLESEYVWVHFALEMKEIPEISIFLEGRFQQFSSAPVPCIYNSELGVYSCKVLLKQGYYNYRFVEKNNYSKEVSLSYTEGNYSSTENDYHAIVYMYDRNQGCDRVIAVQADNSVR